jgi:hypothetical protein
MRLAFSGDTIGITFLFSTSDGKPAWHMIPDGERMLTHVRFFGYVSTEGDVRGVHSAMINGAYNLSDLESALPLLRRIDKFLSAARQETEDNSFEELAALLAAHFRVTRVLHPGGEGTRGAARIIARRMSAELVGLDAASKALALAQLEREQTGQEEMALIEQESVAA